MNLQFLASIFDPLLLPKEDIPEVLVVGRSNAGKSTFLNTLARRKIAKVSQTPGKTRGLIFFEAPGKYRLVDTPGYGYAKGDEAERVSWRGLLEGYLVDRKQLQGVLLLMDIRREFGVDEKAFTDWLGSYEIPFCLVLTKADKVSKNQMRGRIQSYMAKTNAEMVFATSSMIKESVDQVEDYFFRAWLKDPNGNQRSEEAESFEGESSQSKEQKE